MVHHFEANQTSSGDAQLTINSQSQIMSGKAPEEVPRRQVTVNNHINVLGDTTPVLETAENFNGQKPDNGYVVDEEALSSPTYESQAMNIRLDVADNKNLQQATANKVRRNKNVDLAYTLVKTNPPKGRAIEAPGQKIGKQQREVEESVEPRSVKPGAATSSIHPNSRPQIVVPVEIHPQVNSNSQPSVASTTPVASVAPVAAVAPVAPERRLSNASSSNSVVDKSVVRHYVANDRSIYERRKYDEIEFEEFEVYDPSKEVPSEEGQPEKPAADGELYDSLDDKM